jgi:hypothetical protein
MLKFSGLAYLISCLNAEGHAGPTQKKKMMILQVDNSQECLNEDKTRIICQIGVSTMRNMNLKHVMLMRHRFADIMNTLKICYAGPSA